MDPERQAQNDLYERYREEREAAWQALRKARDRGEDPRQIGKDHPLVTWESWLRTEAALGNMVARKALQARQFKMERELSERGGKLLTRELQQRRRSGLYERYQAERAAAIAARKTALRLHFEKWAERAEADRAFYTRRFREEDVFHPRGMSFLRFPSFQHVFEMQARDHAARKAGELEERKQIKEAHPIIRWSEFLRRESERGDAEAKAALGRLQARERKERERQEEREEELER